VSIVCGGHPIKQVTGIQCLLKRFHRYSVPGTISFQFLLQKFPEIIVTGEVIKTGDFKAVHGEGMPQYRYTKYNLLFRVSWCIVVFQGHNTRCCFLLLSVAPGLPVLSAQKSF
jgi:hypothetical protein